MNTSTHAIASPELRSRTLPPRLGSFLAFAPLGVWTVWHLWTNLAAWVGPTEWEAHVTARRAPVAEATLSVAILLPLVLHVAWGTRRLFIAKPNAVRYSTFANWRYVLQRLSAIGLLLFLGAHIWLARINPLLETGRHETFADISWHMRNHAPTLIVYVLGVLGTAYHLANGLATGAMTWGYAASPRAMRRMNVASWCTFVLLAVMGLGSVYALWEHGAVPRVEQRAFHPHATPAAGPAE